MALAFILDGTLFVICLRAEEMLRRGVRDDSLQMIVILRGGLIWLGLLLAACSVKAFLLPRHAGTPDSSWRE